MQRTRFAEPQPAAALQFIRLCLQPDSLRLGSLLRPPVIRPAGNALGDIERWTGGIGRSTRKKALERTDHPVHQVAYNAIAGFPLATAGDVQDSIIRSYRQIPQTLITLFEAPPSRQWSVVSGQWSVGYGCLPRRARKFREIR